MRMMELLRNRLTFVWLGLVLATVLSFETGSDGVFSADPRLLGVAVLAIAFVKVRYIMLEFMELRHAPLAMRLFAEAWWLAIGAAVVAFYWGVPV